MDKELSDRLDSIEERISDIEKSLQDGFDFVLKENCADYGTLLMAINLYVKSIFGKKFHKYFDAIYKAILEERGKEYGNVFKKEGD